MSLETPPQNPLDIIAMIRQEIAVMGFNDSEFYDLDQIVSEYESGAITAEEAISRAQAIKAAKQDYH